MSGQQFFFLTKSSSGMIAIPLTFILGVQVVYGLLLVSPFETTRKLGMKLAKLGKARYGYVPLKTITACLVVLLASSVFQAVLIQRRIQQSVPYGTHGNTMVDQIEFLSTLQEAAMIASSLIVGVLLHCLHDAMSKGDSLKMNLEAVKKQAKGMETEYLRLIKEKEGNFPGESSDLQVGTLKETVGKLRNEIDQLQESLEEKAKEVRSAEASASSLKKQSQGLQLEYERLLQENENLLGQLAQFDKKYSRSDYKKKA